MTSSTTIQFIKNPSFIVDFTQFQEKEETTLSQKIISVVQAPFFWTKCFFLALAESSHLVFKYSWVSFKHIVLGYYGSLSDFRLPSNAYLIVFKVVFWFAATGWTLITTTTGLFLEKALTNPSLDILSTYVDEEIDLRHIQTKASKLDASQVSSEITVDKLLEIFDSINFSDKNAPGYMTAKIYDEGKQCEVSELRIRLETFVTRIKKRTPFLGTPPSYDTPRLMSYYQQIEDAVRLSIHRIETDLAAFKNLSDENPGSYNNKKLGEYNSLLQKRSRLAIDLAIAGSHCGSRYTGEAMSAYGINCGEASMENLNLKQCLIELLAQKRLEIARDEIGRLFTNEKESVSGYNKYMEAFGKLLGLPGTQNISENFSVDLDRGACLSDFFKRYDVDTIIDTTQEKVKESQNLREKIFDWIKDQAREWRKEDYQNLAAQLLQILKQEEASKDQKKEAISKFSKENSKYVYFSPDFKERLLKKQEEEGLKLLIADCFELERTSSFRSKFESKLNNIVTNGLPDTILEWLLVSQNILLPQLEGLE